MHIIAGTLRRRRLETLPGKVIRPTGGMAREAIFNIITHAKREDGEGFLAGQPVADICCGSGAMGLEAISRGALLAVFVDASRDSLDVSRINAQHCHVEAQCRFIRSDAARLPPCPPQGPFSLIFTDPPYREPILPGILKSIRKQGWLAEGGLIIAEQHAKEPTPGDVPYRLEKDRVYGKSRIMFFKE